MSTRASKRAETKAARAANRKLPRRARQTRFNATIGFALVFMVLFGLVFAYTKHIPFTSRGYELKAVFANAATLRVDSPVRIAGVNVGKILSVDPHGEDAVATFTVSGEGQPVHADAQATIRPRLFLEGNFFIDLNPGSPSAADLGSGDTIPVTQTATAVQLDQLLTALQKPERWSLQRLLEGYGTALTHKPTAAEDKTQDPQVQGVTAAAALNDSFRYGGPAGKNGAIVAEALQGTQEHDLSRLIDAQASVFGTLVTRETQLQDLISNFATFSGALGVGVLQPRHDDPGARANARAGNADARPPERHLPGVAGVRRRDPPGNRAAPAHDQRRPALAAPSAPAPARLGARRPREGTPQGRGAQRGRCRRPECVPAAARPHQPLRFPDPRPHRQRRAERSEVRHRPAELP